MQKRGKTCMRLFFSCGYLSGRCLCSVEVPRTFRRSCRPAWVIKTGAPPNSQCWRKTAEETQNERLGCRGRYCLTGRVFSVVVVLGQVEVHFKGLNLIIFALAYNLPWRFLKKTKQNKTLNCCPGGGKAKFTSVPKVADGCAGFRLFWLWQWTRIRISGCFWSRKIRKWLRGFPEKVFSEEQENQDSLRSELEAK